MREFSDIPRPFSGNVVPVPPPAIEVGVGYDDGNRREIAGCDEPSGHVDASVIGIPEDRGELEYARPQPQGAATLPTDMDIPPKAPPTLSPEQTERTADAPGDLLPSPESLLRPDLPPSIAKTLGEVANRAQANENVESAKLDDWVTIDAVQQSVFEQFEKEVLVPRREAWEDAVSFLRATPCSSVAIKKDPFQGKVAEVTWKFEHPRIQDVKGTPMQVFLTVGAQSSLESLPDELRTLLSTATGEAQRPKDIRDAITASKLDIAATRWHMPEPDTVRDAIVEPLLDKTTNLYAHIHTKIVGETRSTLASATAFNRSSLVSPDATIFEQGKARKLSPDTIPEFEWAATHYRSRNDEPPEPFTLECIDHFIRSKLAWSTNRADSFIDTLGFANQCMRV